MAQNSESQNHDKYSKYLKEKRAELLKYEKKKHYELLSQPKELLSDKSKEKLRSYSIILIDQLNWEIQDQYLDLLNKFIEKKIDISDFLRSFFERYRSIEKVADVLKLNRVLLSPDKNSFDFGELLLAIEDCCLAYSGDPDPYEIGEAEFKVSIEKIYFQMKELLKK